MPYTAAKNAVESWFRKKLAKPRVPEYMVGVDTSFWPDATTATTTVTNGSGIDVKITMESVLRVAESIPLRDRGTHLNMPIYSYTFTTGGAQGAANDPIDIQTISIPWQQVYQYKAHQQAVWGLGNFGQLLGGQGQAAQTASGYQASSNMWGYYNQLVYGSAMGGMQAMINGLSDVYVNPLTYPPETPEQVEKRTAAIKRAEGLLFTILKPEQVRQYEDHGYFETEIDDRTYRIKKGRSGNVYLVKNGKEVARYCAHPATWTPDQDVMISQLLMLKTNEKRFLETANRTQLLAA